MQGLIQVLWFLSIAHSNENLNLQWLAPTWVNFIKRWLLLCCNDWWSLTQFGCWVVQNDNQSVRSILIQASDGHFVGRERVVTWDKEPADYLERCLLVHLGHNQLPRVFTLPWDIPVHRVLQLPLPPRTCRLWAEPFDWRISLLCIESAEIRSTSTKQGFTAVVSKTSFCCYWDWFSRPSTLVSDVPFVRN